MMRTAVWTAAALGLSYDQLRHALKRHKLLDAASG